MTEILEKIGTALQSSGSYNLSIVSISSDDFCKNEIQQDIEGLIIVTLLFDPKRHICDSAIKVLVFLDV